MRWVLDIEAGKALKVMKAMPNNECIGSFMGYKSDIRIVYDIHYLKN